MSPERLEVTITSLGAQGDGIAQCGDKTIYVAGALPGETATITLDGTHAKLLKIIDPNVERIAPKCQHFEICGGCTSQHMSDAALRTWKLGLVRQAFAHRGINVEIDHHYTAPLKTRRRAVFAARKADDGTQLGFRPKADHAVFDLIACDVLDPLIVASVPRLRDLADLILPPNSSARVHVLAAANGLDVLFETSAGPKQAEALQRIAQIAQDNAIIRLRLAQEVIIDLATPFVQMSGTRVEVSAETFLQASPPAEEAMVKIVTDATNKAKTVVDLFCGVGTFTLGLAGQSKVLAFDSDATAIAALQQAARSGAGLKPVLAHRRDLFQMPLSRTELNGIDAVVFDPPRQGASEQAAQIARSDVPLVVAVSCNPATLARDVRTLLDSGFVIAHITMIDQFRFTPHVEVIAVLTRKRQSRPPRRRLI